MCEKEKMSIMEIMTEKEKMSIAEAMTEIIKYEDHFDRADAAMNIVNAIRSGNTILEIPMIMVPLQLLKGMEGGETESVYGWCTDNESLLSSLTVDGLQKPLDVIGPMDDGRYQVVDGKRRLDAIRQMGDQFWTTPKADTQKRIPCWLLGDKNAPKVVGDIISIMENKYGISEDELSCKRESPADFSVTKTLQKS